MELLTEADIKELVGQDEWMMDVLRAAEELGLPDWWIGAGFLRSKVWDAIEGNDYQKPRDVDLVYFDDSDASPETDWKYDGKMNETYPFAEWEVRNQARMHKKNGFEPVSSTEEGIARWVETATCVAVRLKMGELAFLYSYGIDDLVNLIARAVPLFASPDRLPVFYERIEQKKWLERWPHLKITTDEV